MITGLGYHLTFLSRKYMYNAAVRLISLAINKKVKKKIKSALMYPMVMFTVAITVMVFMLVKVVPIFAEMYEGMGVALPTPTAVIMTGSNFMRGSGGLTLLIVEQSSERALKAADRLYVLRSGQMQLEGAAKELQDGEKVRQAYFGFDEDAGKDGAVGF